MELAKSRRSLMDKARMTQALLEAKKKKGLTWDALAQQTGLSEMGGASCCYGENSMTPDAADRLGARLEGDTDNRDALLEFPTNANSPAGKVIPHVPLLYP